MSRPTGASASYRTVLELPYARGLFAASMLARLSYGLLSLPLLVSLREGTGSYAAAGSATALFGLVAALLGPFRARLAERRRAALMALAACYSLLLSAIVAACTLGTTPFVAVSLAALAGLFPPPVGPLMRTVWSGLTNGAAQRQRALSLDTAAESTVFAVGPAVGGFLIAATSATVALSSCAVLVIAGFSALSAVLRRAPVSLDPANTGAPLFRTGHSTWRIPAFVPLLLVVFGAGSALSVDEVAVVASWGAGAAGSLMALVSVGGILGGLAYGLREWHIAPRRRLLVLAALSAVCYGLPVLPVLLYAPAGAGVGLFLAGACGDALMITSYLLVDTLVPEGSRMEGSAWINTAYNLGVAMGSGGAGLLIDRWGSVPAFTAGAALLSAVTIVGVLWRSPKSVVRPIRGTHQPSAS